MRRILVLLCLMIASLASSLVIATTVPLGPKEDATYWLGETVPAYSTWRLRVKFEGKKQAAAVCIGDRSSFLGLYVFDSHGNCVACDDINVAKTCDELAVVWIPPEESYHVIEVVNFGKDANKLGDPSKRGSAGGLAVK